jgi:polysaccharide pyruvyl transferase WcaK-like protein
MEILRRTFGPNVRATVASYGFPAFIEEQARSESDPAIRHVALSTTQRWSRQWFLYQVDRRCLGGRLGVLYRGLRSSLDAVVALEIGGDNYSLDYGPPLHLVKMDEYLQTRGIPVVLWGASVGPFEANPEVATRVLAHLRGMLGIFARESVTTAYLRAHGLSSTLREVADPAFAMKAVEPPASRLGDCLPADAVGLNFSPLMASYCDAGDASAWRERCVGIVRAVRTLGRPVVLIPHVTWPVSNDHELLRTVAEQVQDHAVRVLPGCLTAAETKWVISRCAAFAGARTHATIAGFSSCTPTISFTYSAKAKGLNLDMYDSLDYCIPPDDLRPERVACTVALALGNADGIRGRLAARMPGVLERSYRAGEFLREVLTARAQPTR